MTPKVKQEMTHCAELFYDRYEPYHCSRKGKLEHEGKLYCKQHYPPYVKARQTIREEGWERDRKSQALADEIRAAEREVIKAALGLDDIHNSACVCAFCESVQELRKLLELEEKNAKSDKG